MQIIVTAKGIEIASEAIERLGAAEWASLLRLLGVTVEEQTVNHFQEQAGPAGAWAPLKSRTGQILVDTGRLRGSISHAVKSADSVEIGSTVHYGKYHQDGTRKMVARAFLGLTEADQDELKNVVVDYLQSVIGGSE